MASPHPSTSRRRRPCDSCRKRKSRCVLEEDSTICVLCKFHNQECSFLDSPQLRKRRRVQDGDSLEASETRFAWPTLATCPPADKSHSQSNAPGQSRKSPVVHTRAIKTTGGTGVEEYDDLEGHSLLKKTLGLQNKHHSQYVGATRGIEPALLGPLRPGENDIVQLDGYTLRRVSSREAFLLLPDAGTQSYADELNDLDAIEAIVKPHGKALVDMYFRIVFPSFPILHKEVYLEKYSRSYREFSPPLLASVYLLALHYWLYDEELSKSAKPDVQELEKLARKAFGDTIHRPKLSTVQAGLLLLQHTDSDSAELTAQLVSVAYGLGLHLDSSEWNIPQWEKGLRKRLGWALFMQDKWSSLGSGRISLINSSNWALQPVTSLDFPENASHENDKEGSSEVENGRILFTYMITLSIILADLLESVFTVKTEREISAAGPNGISILLEKVKPMQLRLKEWFSNLPDCLSMEATPVMKLNSVGYLRLAYVATEITLHRRIMLALHPSTNPQLIQICRSVAHQRFMFAIDFVHSLKPQHLSSFWYFASAQNFALVAVFGTVLLSTAYNSEEADFYRKKLREYRWMLKMNSENGAPYMKPAIALLDANTRLIERNNINRTQSSANRSHATQLASSNSHVPTTDDFNFPGQFAFDTLNYRSRHSESTSPYTFSTDNTDALSESWY